MSSLYKNKYVVADNKVTRIINTNDMIEEKLQSYREMQKQQQLEELRKSRAEELGIDESELPKGEEKAFVQGLFAEQVEVEPEVDYVEEAKMEAERILEEARMHAEQMVSDASSEATRIREDASREGHNQGYEEGSKKAQSEVQRKMTELDNERAMLQKDYEARLSELEPQLLQTILQIVDRVFHTQLQNKGEVMLYLLKNAIDNIRETKNLKIRVSSEDVDAVRACKQEFADQIGEGVNVEILRDITLESGQCMIDADSGVYDCSIEVELENLLRELKTVSL